MKNGEKKRHGNYDFIFFGEQKMITSKNQKKPVVKIFLLNSSKFVSKIVSNFI